MRLIVFIFFCLFLSKKYVVFSFTCGLNFPVGLIQTIPKIFYYMASIVRYNSYREKHPSLVGPFVSYEEKEVLSIQTQALRLISELLGIHLNSHFFPRWR